MLVARGFLEIQFVSGLLIIVPIVLVLWSLIVDRYRAVKPSCSCVFWAEI